LKRGSTAKEYGLARSGELRLNAVSEREPLNPRIQNMNEAMASCLVAAFAPMGCLAPWDARHWNPAGCWKFYPTGRAGGLGVATDSGLTDPPRRFYQVVGPQGIWAWQWVEHARLQRPACRDRPSPVKLGPRASAIFHYKLIKPVAEK
jgi:hypothetical protein